MKCTITVLVLAALATPNVARADTNPDYTPGPWHYRAVSCVDTTVKSVTPRLGSMGQTTYTAKDYEDSGVYVIFTTGLGMQPLFAKETASIVHYQDSPGNTIMRHEHSGDKVQVCFLGGPAPHASCNPDKDDRARNYRVYDYRQKQQYWGTNSEHDCGGA